METLTLKHIMRNARKMCMTAITILVLMVVLSLLLYMKSPKDSIISIIGIIATLVSCVVLVYNIHIMLKCNADNVSVILDKCIGSKYESPAGAGNIKTKMSLQSKKYMLTFFKCEQFIVLPQEYDTVRLGKEYYIVMFNNNKDMAQFYSAEEWKLDKEIQTKLQHTLAQK